MSFCFNCGTPAALALVLAVVSCGSDDKNSNDAAPVGDFQDSLLTAFTSWTPVLNGDVAFSSTGHSGQTVRVFFNEVAAPHFKEEKVLPLTSGSYVAKAVVSAADSPATAATRVYFMLKKPAGFDDDNGNWSYAVANIKDGKLTFDAAQGKNSSCSGCHKNEAAWDYLRTIDYFRKQKAN